MSNRAIVRKNLPAVIALLLLGCGPVSTPFAAAPAGLAAVAAAPAPSPSPTLAPTPSPSAAPSPLPASVAEATPMPPTTQPDSRFVSFSGFAAGTYPVHLHRLCNGSQGYHLAYLPYLAISAAGVGGVAIPAGDFGRGWCVVVYANRAATVVAAYRPI